jgi:alpha-L-arabinofuranosidase
MMILSSDDLEQANTIDEPMKISPVTQSINIYKSLTDVTLQGYSLNVIRVGLQ